MMINGILPIRFIVVGIALSLTAGGALADKPSWAGGGKNKKGDKHHEEKVHNERNYHDGHHNSQQDDVLVYRFGSHERRVVNEYYSSQGHHGKYPPGQVKKWHRGQPLPKHVIYYDLPQELYVRLPPPPPHHRYVQVAGDILMIAIGSSMVVDAIDDILH